MAKTMDSFVNGCQQHASSMATTMDIVGEEMLNMPVEEILKPDFNQNDRSAFSMFNENATTHVPSAHQLTMSPPSWYLNSPPSSVESFTTEPHSSIESPKSSPLAYYNVNGPVEQSVDIAYIANGSQEISNSFNFVDEIEEIFNDNCYEDHEYKHFEHITASTSSTNDIELNKVLYSNVMLPGASAIVFSNDRLQCGNSMQSKIYDSNLICNSIENHEIISTVDKLDDEESRSDGGWEMMDNMSVERALSDDSRTSSNSSSSNDNNSNRSIGSDAQPKPVTVEAVSDTSSAHDKSTVEEIEQNSIARHLMKNQKMTPLRIKLDALNTGMGLTGECNEVSTPEITNCILEMENEKFDLIEYIDSSEKMPNTPKQESKSKKRPSTQSISIDDIEIMIPTPIATPVKRSRQNSYENPNSVSSLGTSEDSFETKSQPKRRGRPPKTESTPFVPEHYEKLSAADRKYLEMRNRNNEASRRSRQNRKSKESVLSTEATVLERKHIRLIELEKSLMKQCRQWRRAVLRLAQM